MVATPMAFGTGILIKKLFIGGVHKLMILQRDFVDDFLTKFFGEEMGGSGGPRPPSVLFAVFIVFVLPVGILRHVYEILGTCPPGFWWCFRNALENCRSFYNFLLKNRSF